MDQFVKDQIVYGLKYVPANLLKAAFIPKSSPETKAFRENHFMWGVSHPDMNYEQIKAANLDWARYDVPFPFDKNGEITDEYKAFKKRCTDYTEHGIKVQVNTPYPRDYEAVGIKIDTPDGDEKIKEIARFFIEDLRGCVHAFQVANEMGIPRFTVPYTMEQAVKFLGIQLEAMYPIKGDILVSYNSPGPAAQLNAMMKPYYKYCDFIGIDIYLGCFLPVTCFRWMFDAVLDYFWAFTRKPVVLQEFGYVGGGAPKTKQERTEILKSYGVNSEKDAKANIQTLMKNVPESVRKRIKFDTQDNEKLFWKYIFKGDFRNHFFRELPRATKLHGYEHTREGQAKFFEDMIPRFYKKEYLGGLSVFSYTDQEACYVCGQSDCPTETCWGMVDCSGKEKPSYYAVRDAIAKLKK